MNICVVEHQHKAQPYINALLSSHHHIKRIPIKADCLLIDHEWAGLFAGLPKVTWRKQILEAEQRGMPIFIYPHSVRPNIPHDLTDQYYQARALFTIAEGHKEVLRRIGYPNPIEVMGWPYTEIKPFRQRKSNGKIRVLFAPIHPVGNGYLPDAERELNAKTYKKLLGLTDKIDLTVRHVQPLESSGLWFDERAKIIRGAMDGSTKQMNGADVIVAAFTFAYMAVALGHPLVMMGEGIKPHNSPRGVGKLIYARNWEKYKDYMKFPHNVEDCSSKTDLLDMLKRAMQAPPDEWKERFIGQPFDGRRFVKTLEGYL
jgi:hypothetical protein